VRGSGLGGDEETTVSATTYAGLELKTLVTAEGGVELFLERADVGPPGPQELVIRVEAAPVNPSDLGLLLGPGDPLAGRADGEGEGLRFHTTAPLAALGGLKARLGRPLSAGNEGAGIVVAVGEGAPRALIGRTAAAIGGGMYAQYRRLPVADCLIFPEGTPPAAAASAFVNPLTALGMVDTMRLEGHTALVHTAAASNLGRMLNRICRAEEVGLVNVVRSPAQAELLVADGARLVVDQSRPDFAAALQAAVAETGATLAFDAVGGGLLASRILSAMEAAAQARMEGYSRYGSSVHKQVYIYGALDLGPTELRRSFGMSWGVGGWLLWPFLHRVGPERAEALRERVRRELDTTFRSDYAGTLSLTEALTPACVAAYSRRATGAKYLIAPWKDA
jgi:NADPH:quinone reductase-like Zn-dependent oxidoreductase